MSVFINGRNVPELLFKALEKLLGVDDFIGGTENTLGKNPRDKEYANQIVDLYDDVLLNMRDKTSILEQFTPQRLVETEAAKAEVWQNGRTNLEEMLKRQGFAAEDRTLLQQAFDNSLRADLGIGRSGRK